MEHQLLVRCRALVGKGQLETLVQESQFANSGGQDLIIECSNLGKNVRIRQKMNLGAMFVLRCRANHFHRRVHLAANKVNVVTFATTSNRDVQISRQRIHD